MNQSVNLLEDPRRWGISPVGPVGGVVSPGARDGGLTGDEGFTDERRWGMSPISPGVKIKCNAKTITTSVP